MYSTYIRYGNDPPFREGVVVKVTYEKPSKLKIFIRKLKFKLKYGILKKIKKEKSNE